MPNVLRFGFVGMVFGFAIGVLALQTQPATSTTPPQSAQPAPSPTPDVTPNKRLERWSASDDAHLNLPNDGYPKRVVLTSGDLEAPTTPHRDTRTPREHSNAQAPPPSEKAKAPSTSLTLVLTSIAGFVFACIFKPVLEKLVADRIVRNLSPSKGVELVMPTPEEVATYGRQVPTKRTL